MTGQITAQPMLSAIERIGITTAEYADALRGSGHRGIIALDGTLWISHESYSVMRFPIIPQEQVDDTILTNLFWRHHIPIVSYVVEPSKSHPANSLLYLCNAESYRFDDLSKNARRDARLALRQLRFAFVGKESFRDAGYAPFQNTRARIGLNDGSLSQFQKLYHWATNVDGHYVFGAWKDDLLLAYIGFAAVDDWVEINSVCTLDAGKSFCPNDGLIHVLLEELLNRRQFRTVGYGLSSLQDAGAAGGLHHFKTKVGFPALPVYRVFEVHPLLRSIVNGLSLRLVTALVLRHPSNRRLRKAKGAMDLILSARATRDHAAAE
jgi:hypothetical protein